MSMAGLRYCPSSPTGPLETKSGAYVYSGDPSHFHEWQFRTLLRVELCKKKMEQKAKEKAKEASSSPITSPASSGRRRRQPTDAAGRGDAEEEEAAAEVSPQAPSGEHEIGDFASPRSHHEDDDFVDASPYVELVTKVMEGLRGDAFLMAKDLGLNALMDAGPPTGLELLVERIKEHVFPLRSHEARELFRLGQQANGPLSRQSAETIFLFYRKTKPLVDYTHPNAGWASPWDIRPRPSRATHGQDCLPGTKLRRIQWDPTGTPWKNPSEGFKKLGPLGPSFKALSSERSREEQRKGVVSIGLLCRWLWWPSRRWSSRWRRQLRLEWGLWWRSLCWVWWWAQCRRPRWLRLGVRWRSWQGTDSHGCLWHGRDINRWSWGTWRGLSAPVAGLRSCGTCKRERTLQGIRKGQGQGEGQEGCEDPIVHPRQESQTCQPEEKQSLPTLWRLWTLGQVTQNSRCPTRNPVPQRRSQVKCRAKGRLATLPWVIPQETMMVHFLAWSLEQGVVRRNVGT